MSSESLQIDLSKHLVIRDQDTNEVVITQNKYLLLWDKMRNTTIEVPDIPQVRQYFGVEPMESANEDDDTNMTDMILAKSPTSDDKKTTAFWKDENAVKTLIHQWKQHQPLFESSVIRNDVVWTKISEELKKTNNMWQYTGKNCENKFKDITKVYKRTKDHNNQTGVEPKTCKYFEELEEVLGEKPCLKPVSLASSLQKRSNSAASSSTTSFNDYTTSDDVESNEETSNKSKKPKKTRMERELELWTKTTSEENRKCDEAKERRHQELLARQDRARETYEYYMTKLLEKL